MGREFPIHPIVGVGAIILKEDEVLLIKRGTPPSKGNWSIPGGGVELGESLREACHREVMEETGLEIEIIEQCAVLDRIIKDSINRVQFHYVLIDYLCSPVGGNLQADTDATEILWHNIHSLQSIKNMTEQTAKIIYDAIMKFRGET